MDNLSLLIPIFIAVAIVIRLVAGFLDHGRVRQYIESRGGKIIELSWSPLGPGWLGEKSDRIYAVRYLDQDGNEHQGYCKTSISTGIYFTEDQIIKHVASLDEQPHSLKEENRRLREELDKLKRGQA